MKKKSILLQILIYFLIVFFEFIPHVFLKFDVFWFIFIFLIVLLNNYVFATFLPMKITGNF